MWEKIREMLGSKDPEMNTLGEALKKEQELKNMLHLPLIQMMQKQNPNLIVCGSTALYLQGLRLKRWEKNNSDLDIVVPYYFKYLPTEGYNVVTDDLTKSYGNDFDYSFIIDNIVIDVRIDNKKAYNLVTLDDIIYKVCKVEDILEAKLKYGQAGNQKHIRDIYELIGLKNQNQL